MLSGGSPSLQAGKRGAEGRRDGALCTEEQQGTGEEQGQCSASLPWHLGRGKEGWRARVGGTGWVPSLQGKQRREKTHILGSLQKEKKRKKHPEGTSGVGEAALFVPGFVTVNLYFKKFANQG